jgi:hypothetical protein
VGAEDLFLLLEATVLAAEGAAVGLLDRCLGFRDGEIDGRMVGWCIMTSSVFGGMSS